MGLVFILLIFIFFLFFLNESWSFVKKYMYLYFVEYTVVSNHLTIYLLKKNNEVNIKLFLCIR